MARPFIKWVGGKTQLLPQLEKWLPPRDKINTYYEPFVGGGALYFYLEHPKSVISDLNTHLINLYRHIKLDLNLLLPELDAIEKEYIPLSEEGRKSFYYEARKKYNSIQNEAAVEKSALLIFLNRTCFNGMYRENPRGEFNIPFGKNHLSKIYNPDILKDASRLLKKTQILNVSYEKTLTQASKNDFIYLDPPYVPLNATTSNFTQYLGEDFKENEHEKLFLVFKLLAEKGCYVMMSNSDTPFVRETYKEYNIHEVLANRFINCKSEGRGKITELVITNYA